jgi:superfamily II DNA or RNA helicase
MEYDWSDAWLQQAAGWKAVKDGVSLHSRRLVQNARLNEGECQGVIASSKPRRVRVRRLTASTAETLCGCPENQRTGAMCEHAVAVIIAARETREGEKPSSHEGGSSQTAPQASVARVKAYRVRWYPSWQREWQQHRLTVAVENSDRLIDEADTTFHEWVTRQGLNQKPLPWMLSLEGQTLESFLAALTNHADVVCEKQTIVCNSGMPQVRVRSRSEEDHWVFMLDDIPGEFLGNKVSAWWRKNEHLFEINSLEDRIFLFQLFTEKQAIITHSQYFLSIELQQILISAPGHDEVSEVVPSPVDPYWRFHVDGSLRQLRMTVKKLYRMFDRSWEGEIDDYPGFLGQFSNKCFYSVPGDGLPVRQRLQNLGWVWRKERGEWQLSDEALIQRFVANGHEDFGLEKCDWVWTSNLTTIRERCVVVKPQIEIVRTNHEASRVSMSFVTEQGKPLDADKIRHLLQSGKRSIQTNDGKTLLLPQESWDVFQRSVSDLRLMQKQGEYLASRHQEIAIEYLRAYVYKTLTFNDLSNEKELALPLLDASLRSYQSEGVCWLHDRLSRYGFALLADEMGLGKTLQTIAVLSLLAKPGEPALVIVPTSLLDNWRLEIERFAPSLKVLVIHGVKRDKLHESSGHHVIVTSYGILVNDRALFLKREYSLMVLDEASVIRNPDTEVARCCFRMKAAWKLALTGTPLENHLRDLWSIFQFLQPGYLGDRKVFHDTYEAERLATLPALQSLRVRVMPFMLRRTKDEVAKDLPAKIESDDWSDLSQEQAQLYRTVWEEGMARVESARLQSEAAGRMSLLTLLLRLRQICCDAALIAPELVQSWSLEQRSRKMERMFELWQGTVDSGRKMLVFSQFAQQLQLINKECQKRQVETLVLDGSTRNRQELVDRFQQSDGPSLFLISLKAGGYGLNLTRASTVVHFDPWWNPAVERQASDRAHRIGQTQTVNVYRLLTRGTVEERVKKLQAEKSRLVDQIFDAGTGFLTMPTMDQLDGLLRHRS